MGAIRGQNYQVLHCRKLPYPNIYDKAHRINMAATNIPPITRYETKIKIKFMFAIMGSSMACLGFLGLKYTFTL